MKIGRFSLTTHGFTVCFYDLTARRAFGRFLVKQVGVIPETDRLTGIVTYKKTKVHGFEWEDKKTYSFPRTAFSDFWEAMVMAGFKEEKWDWVDCDPVTISAIGPYEYPRGGDFSFTVNLEPRENQKVALEYLNKASYVKVLPLPTGQGKTLTSSFTYQR